MGYTQSDEISLFWSLDLKKDEKASFFFAGNFQKITSVLASMATAYFMKELPTRIPEKAEELATFDCRAWSAASLREVYLNFLWRQHNCVENSVFSKSHAHLPHAQLQLRSSAEKREMLRQIGQPWDAEPQFFKSGTFVGWTPLQVRLTPERLAQIPTARRPPGGVVMREAVRDLGLGPLHREPPERIAALFGCAVTDGAPQ